MTHSFPTRRSSELRTVARYSAAPGSTVFQERRPAPEPRAIPAFLKYRLPMAGNGEPLSHGLLRPIVKFIQQMKRLHSCQRTGTGIVFHPHPERSRSEEHTSELQSLMRISYAVFCLKKKKKEKVKN